MCVLVYKDTKKDRKKEKQSSTKLVIIILENIKKFSDLKKPFLLKNSSRQSTDSNYTFQILKATLSKNKFLPTSGCYSPLIFMIDLEKKRLLQWGPPPAASPEGPRGKHTVTGTLVERLVEMVWVRLIDQQKS